MSAPEPVPLPFVAPCRTLAARAPLDWLRKGWADYRRAPGQSLAYGAVIVALSWCVTAIDIDYIICRDSIESGRSLKFDKQGFRRQFGVLLEDGSLTHDLMSSVLMDSWKIVFNGETFFFLPIQTTS